MVAGMPLAAERTVEPLRWYRPVRRERRNGVTILRAWSTTRSTRRFSGRLSNYITYFLSATLATVRLGRPDVVVALTDPPIIALPALAAARIARARFVFLCQDVFPEVARLLEDFRNARVEAALAWTSRFVVKHADGIVAIGDTMKQRLIEIKGADPEKIRVIHNWADTEAIRPGPKDNAFAQEHGLVDKFVVMHSGNVGLSQDVDGLLDVAEGLRDLADLVVAIVGDGARKEFLQAEVARRRLTNVRFFPYQPKDIVSQSFATADVFVVSLKRGMAGFIVPSKLYGILAAGRPFVAAVDADSEVAQISHKHTCGIIVPPASGRLLTAAIRRLYSDEAQRRRLAGHARTASFAYDRRRAAEAYRDTLEGTVR